MTTPDTQLCGATRDGRTCVRPAGERDYRGLPHDQHRAADGKRWYYSDGEREADQGVPLIDLVERDRRRLVLEHSADYALHHPEEYERAIASASAAIPGAVLLRMSQERCCRVVMVHCQHELGLITLDERDDETTQLITESEEDQP